MQVGQRQAGEHQEAGVDQHGVDREPDARARTCPRSATRGPCAHRGRPPARTGPAPRAPPARRWPPSTRRPVPPHGAARPRRPAPPRRPRRRARREQPTPRGPTDHADRPHRRPPDVGRVAPSGPASATTEDGAPSSPEGVDAPRSAARRRPRPGRPRATTRRRSRRPGRPPPPPGPAGASSSGRPRHVLAQRAGRSTASPAAARPPIWSTDGEEVVAQPRLDGGAGEQHRSTTSCSGKRAERQHRGTAGGEVAVVEPRQHVVATLGHAPARPAGSSPRHRRTGDERLVELRRPGRPTPSSAARRAPAAGTRRAAWAPARRRRPRRPARSGRAERQQRGPWRPRPRRAHRH